MMVDKETGTISEILACVRDVDWSDTGRVGGKEALQWCQRFLDRLEMRCAHGHACLNTR
jgi:hypothetical protein